MCGVLTSHKGRSDPCRSTTAHHVTVRYEGVAGRFVTERSVLLLYSLPVAICESIPAKTTMRQGVLGP